MQVQPENTVDNKRIAKNTALLYVRMLFSMAVGLFTSRVILASLGVIDYGINNVVGGVVTMFGFLNAAMTTSTLLGLTEHEREVIGGKVSEVINRFRK